MNSLPSVAVIIPAGRAVPGIQAALDAVRRQDYPHVVDVVVAVSDTATAEIAERGGARVIFNPSGHTPSGLNLALRDTRSDVVVRVDAHSIIPDDYVSRAIAVLLETGADNVGGMQVPAGETFWERAIATAMSSRLGAGDARHRVGGAAGPAETVYLGVFKRSTLQRLGAFDERFHRNQDYELNHRIIESGGTVWFDPSLRVTYRPRGSLRDLASQYFQYGRWKRRMARVHPGSLRIRQIAPPLLVIGLVASLIASTISPWAWLVPGLYLLVTTLGGLAIGRWSGPAVVGVPLALMTMHIAWGAGFLIGRVPSRRR